MKHLFSYLLLIPLLCSCTNEKKESIDFEKIAPPSNYTLDESTKSATEPSYIDQLSPFERQWLDSLGISAASHRIEALDSTSFIDRFGHVDVSKTKCVSQHDSVVLLVWTFKDSIATKNAFYNWLDCNGTSCISYKIGDVFRLSRQMNVLLYVSETHIVRLERTKIIPNQQFYFRPNQNKERILYFITQTKGKKCRWLQLTIDNEGNYREEK